MTPVKKHTHRNFTHGELAFIRTAILANFPKQEIATFLNRDISVLSRAITRHKLAPRVPRQSDLIALGANYGLEPGPEFEALDNPTGIEYH